MASVCGILIACGSLVSSQLLEIVDLKDYVQFNGSQSDGQRTCLALGMGLCITVAAASVFLITLDWSTDNEIAKANLERDKALKERDELSERAFEIEERLETILNLHDYFDRANYEAFVANREAAQNGRFREIAGRVLRLDSSIPVKVAEPCHDLRELLPFLHEYLVARLRRLNEAERRSLSERSCLGKKGNRFEIVDQVTTNMPTAKSPSKHCKHCFEIDCGEEKEAAALAASRESSVVVWSKNCVRHGELENVFRHLYSKQARHIACFAAIPIRINRRSEYSELVICIDSKENVFPPEPLSWFRLIQEVMSRRFVGAAYKTWSETCLIQQKTYLKRVSG